MLLNKRLLALASLLIQTALALTPITRASAKHGLNHYFVENLLPLAKETHEIVKVPNSSIVLVSQMSNSVLVKARVDERGIIKGLSAFLMGTNTSALHGLHNSKVFPGMVWVTLQNDNKLLLIDPKVHSLRAAPVLLKEISVPAPGLGPHYVGEYGNDLWSSLQDSYAVLRISHVDPSDYTIYQGIPRPVFVAQHPISKVFYTGQDDSSAIMRIDPKTGSTSQYMVPPEIGYTPVGMISGPHGVWFTLLGNATSGTGMVGFIDAHNKITYHKLQSVLGQNAALLHLAFDLNVAKNHVIWLLSSSIYYNDALNSIIKITFDAKYQSILKEEVMVLPTQYSKAHRILITPNNIFATELASSKLLTYFKKKK